MTYIEEQESILKQSYEKTHREYYEDFYTKYFKHIDQLIKMNRIKEYINLIGKGILNIDKIIEGTINSVKSEFGMLTDLEQQEIVKRRLICQSCPLNSINAKTSEEYKTLYGENYKSDRVDLHCSICSCNINLKTSSLYSGCGIQSYNEEHKENKQPLKWDKFN